MPKHIPHYAMVLPFMALFAIFFLYPIASGLYYSFFDWNAMLRRAGAHGWIQHRRRLQRQGAEATIVVAGGGVIAAQPLLWTAFVEEVETAFSGRIAAKLFTGAPAEGACRLAAELVPAPSYRGAAERVFE
jgi:ABC-type sugar transport system permease subunit